MLFSKAITLQHFFFLNHIVCVLLLHYLLAVWRYRLSSLFMLFSYSIMSEVIPTYDSCQNHVSFSVYIFIPTLVFFFPQCFVCVHSFLSLIAQSGSGVYSTLVREILKMCYLRIWQLCIVRCFAFTWPLFKGVMNLSFKSMCYCPTHNC